MSKTKPPHFLDRYWPHILIGLIVTLILAYTGFVLYVLNSNTAHMQAWIKGRQEWFDANKVELMYVYTDLFPQVSKCSVQECNEWIRYQIDTKLNSVLGITYGREKVGRLPVFFIRLKDENHIEKLYQSGDYSVEELDTPGERMAVEMLQGTRDPFEYPQYTCCGGDDILLDLPIIRHFLPPRVYLGDFQTEIEHIYLMRDDKNQILGGLVFLYGD
jgi:hypothetical protein